MKCLRLAFVIFSFFFFTHTLCSQVEYSVNNLLRYGDGREFRGGFEPTKEYIENLANVRLFWKDFSIGFRYLYDNPPEFGPRFTGIRKKYIEFTKYGLEVRGGDFFTLYGRGLAMNLFENRGINYDTGLDGLRASYKGDYFNAIIAAGKFVFYDLVNPSRIEDYTLRSGNIELKPISFMRIGGSFVSVDGDIPNQSTTSRLRAYIPELNFSLTGYGFDFTASYANKKSLVDRTSTVTGVTESLEKSGDGIYASLAYASDAGFGMAIEYKDYRFDKANPNERSAARDTRMLPMQNPPTVLKEHSFTLLTRAPHIIDFNDEIGVQVDGFYQITPEFTLNVNASVASRHQSFSKVPNSFRLRVEKEVQGFPVLDTDFAPFWESYTELEWYFKSDSYVRAAFNRRYDVTNDFLVTHTVASSTVPIRVEYALVGSYSTAAELQVQFVHDTQYEKDPDFKKPNYSNEFLAIILTHAPDWAVTMRMEASSLPSRLNPSGRDFWLAGEFTYRVRNAHTITVSYGHDRGGLICASGICRQVNPFHGFRITLLTQW